MEKLDVDTIVCISSPWAFDLHVSILFIEFCKASDIEFLWMAIEYSLRKKEEHNCEFTAQKANVVSCLIDLNDSENSALTQMNDFNKKHCLELLGKFTL